MNDLTTVNTGELVDELVSRALVRGEPYIRLYANDLVNQLNEIAEQQKEKVSK